jgi:hypothetical protein
MSLIEAQSITKRLWIDLSYNLISPTLIFFGLKRIRSWAEVEEDVKRLEAQTGEPFARTPAHVEGLKREQAKSQQPK